MRLDRRHVIAGLAALAASRVFADDAALQALRQGQALAIMRHALAPGTGDPARFEIGDCSTQRNLNAAGREQARATGAMLRDAGVTFGRVLTSQWCRCRETAALLEVGPVEDAPVFNSHFAGRGDREGQRRGALDLLGSATLPVMVVTHQVNISALTGQSTRSGEVLVARPLPDRLEVLGSLLLPA